MEESETTAVQPVGGVMARAMASGLDLRGLTSSAPQRPPNLRQRLHLMGDSFAMGDDSSDDDQVSTNVGLEDGVLVSRVQCICSHVRSVRRTLFHSMPQRPGA